MKKIFALIVVGVFIVTGITYADNVKVREYLAKKKGVEISNLDLAIQNEAVNSRIAEERAEVIRRIRNKKIDEGKFYVPTDKEIDAYFDKKINAINSDIEKIGEVNDG